MSCLGTVGALSIISVTTTMLDSLTMPASEEGPRPAWLIIVPPSEPALFEYLAERFARVAFVRVILDRRKPQPGEATHGDVGRAERRAPVESALPAIAGVRAARVRGAAPCEVSRRPEGQGRDRGRTSVDNERFQRWLQEGQQVLGEFIPALLEDRERLTATLQATEREREALRREALALREEVRHLGARETSLREAIGTIMHLLDEPHHPQAG